MNSSDLLEQQRFLVFGAARSGIAAARLLSGRGKKVALFDEAVGERLDEARARAREIGVPLLNRIGEAGFPDGWEVLVLSPGIPTTHPLVRLAEESGCVVRSEIEIGYQACRAPILAVTGTNGKTTVTHLVAHLLKASGRPAVMAGNVGHPLCDAVAGDAASGANTVIVCEVSDYQLETTERFRPRTACVLNLTPDHLDRYGSMDNYAEAKYGITENQEADDLLVLNADDPYCRSFAARTAARVEEFSVSRSVERGAFLQGNVLILADGDRREALMERRDIPLQGLHNVENVLAAVCMAGAAGADIGEMARAVRTFRAVPHRIEPVADIDGVRYFNDSKATNLDSLEKALESFDEPIVLIAGGRDKGAPWERLRNLVKRRVKALVLVGEAAPIGRAAWADCVGDAEDAADMEDAVRRARSLAAPGDVVLLSPACASFDMYRSYEERGDHFKAIVGAMGPAAGISGSPSESAERL